jgi:hypothetical protein
VALASVKIKESEQKWYIFPLKQHLEARDQFTVKMEHLKNNIEIWAVSEFFELKYLLALLLQIANSQYNYTLKDINSAFHLLYETTIYKLLYLTDEE